MIWIIFQHGNSAVDKFNNENSTMIGAVEGSSYRGEMKDESKIEIQDIVQKIISLEFDKTRNNWIKKQCFAYYIDVNKSRNGLLRVRISMNISSNELNQLNLYST